MFGWFWVPPVEARDRLRPPWLVVVTRQGRESRLNGWELKTTKLGRKSGENRDVVPLDLTHNLSPICGFPLPNTLQLAFGAAALNIQIPLMLGDLVNVVARYTREHVGNYMSDIRTPALKLLGLYGLQVSVFASRSTPVSHFVTWMVSYSIKERERTLR